MRKIEDRSTHEERTRRTLNSAVATNVDDPISIMYQHSVFCQSGLPYRDPGEDVYNWERLNGHISLSIQASKAMHPVERRFVQLGLPFGPKPRLILAHLNGEALRQQSANIEVEKSLTAFVRKLHLDANGRTLNTIKDQLARLSAAHITLGMHLDGRSVTVDVSQRKYQTQRKYEHSMCCSADQRRNTPLIYKRAKTAWLVPSLSRRIRISAAVSGLTGVRHHSLNRRMVCHIRS